MDRQDSYLNQDHTTTPTAAELLLPWHASGALPARKARQIDAALGRDADLTRQFAVARAERAAIVALNEMLGAPSPRASVALFAAIDADGISRGNSC